MRKTREHGEDVRRKATQTRKWVQKNRPNSSIRAIIKFKATGESAEDVSVHLTPRSERRMVRLAKESPRISAGELVAEVS